MFIYFVAVIFRRVEIPLVLQGEAVTFIYVIMSCICRVENNEMPYVQDNGKGTF